MFDVGIDPWGDDGTFRKPCFVVTHRPSKPVVKGPTTFTFVTDGPESALEQAKAAAGDENVVVMGGATTMRQYLRAGLVDELRRDAPGVPRAALRQVASRSTVSRKDRSGNRPVGGRAGRLPPHGGRGHLASGMTRALVLHPIE